MTEYQNITYLDVDRDAGEMQSQWFGQNRDYHLERPSGSAEDAASAGRVISGGTITPQPGLSRALQIDTEAGAATDELDQIAITNIPEGAEVEIRSTDASRVIEMRHGQPVGTGGLNLRNQVSYFLDDPVKRVRLKRVGTALEEIYRSHMGITQTTRINTTSSASHSLAISKNARKIVIPFNQISTDGANVPLVRIGTGGVLATTGYTGGATDDSGAGLITSTLGFRICRGWAAADNGIGHMVLQSSDPASPSWVATWQIYQSNSGVISSGSGRITLADRLDILALITTGGNVFDAGHIGVAVEE